MSDLGTLSTHHFRPHVHTTDDAWKARGAIGRVLPKQLRADSGYTPTFGVDYWHYPVRLEMRALAFFSGTSDASSWPFTGTPQPLTDAHGRRYYHAHHVPILWAAGAGDRSLTVSVRHNYTSGPYPYVLIDDRADLGLDAARLDCPSTPNVNHDLEHEFTLTADAIVQLWLACDNTTPGEFTTWATVSTA